MGVSDKEGKLLQEESEQDAQGLSEDQKLLEIEQYFEALVKSLPEWAQKLFEQRKCMFSVNKSGSLSLQFEEESVGGTVQKEVLDFVSAFLEQNPSPIFEEVYLH